VQRTAGAPLAALAIQLACVSSRARIDEDDRVQLRPGLVVGLDACDVLRHQLLGRDLAGGHRRLQLRDALLSDVELASLGSRTSSRRV